MKYFLAKSEPTTYSIDDLERDHKTTWDGVTNPQAVMNIREMSPGDRVFIYHSMGEAAIMGIAGVVSVPRPDPKNARLAVVELEFLRRLEPSVTLREIKESHLFDDWSLVRQGRLSTMAAPRPFAEWMRKKFPSAKL